jgi:type IV pilus assembly protein PilM
MTDRKSVWGIDVGNYALKAVRVLEADGPAEVVDFHVIPHADQADGNRRQRRELLLQSVQRLTKEADLRGSHVVIAVPGASSYSRFVHLAAVEREELPDLVHFEATQQMPVPIDEVIWRWQTFRDLDRPGMPDVDAGIFALNRDDVGEMLLLFVEAGVAVDTMQAAPLALYNLLASEQCLAAQEASLVLDLGAGETDAVIAHGRRIWTRTAPLGSGCLTESLALSLGLSLDQAEAMKRDLPAGEQGRAALEAMDRGFVKIATTIKEALATYGSLHPMPHIPFGMAVGGGFRLEPLRQFVEAEIGIPLFLVPEAPRLKTGSSAKAAAGFHEHLPELAVACGLAIQGLGRAVVHTNFLPSGIEHKYGWSRPGDGQGVVEYLRRVLGEPPPPQGPV